MPSLSVEVGTIITLILLLMKLRPKEGWSLVPGHKGSKCRVKIWSGRWLHFPLSWLLYAHAFQSHGDLICEIKLSPGDGDLGVTTLPWGTKPLAWMNDTSLQSSWSSWECTEVQKEEVSWCRNRVTRKIGGKARKNCIAKDKMYFFFLNYRQF